MRVAVTTALLLAAAQLHAQPRIEPPSELTCQSLGNDASIHRGNKNYARAAELYDAEAGCLTARGETDMAKFSRSLAEAYRTLAEVRKIVPKGKELDL